MYLQFSVCIKQGIFTVSTKHRSFQNHDNLLPNREYMMRWVLVDRILCRQHQTTKVQPEPLQKLIQRWEHKQVHCHITLLGHSVLHNWQDLEHFLSGPARSSLTWLWLLTLIQKYSPRVKTDIKVTPCSLTFH